MNRFLEPKIMQILGYGGVMFWGLVCLLHFVGSYYFPWFPPLRVFSADMLLHSLDLLGRLAMFWFAAWGVGAWVLKIFRLAEVSLFEGILLEMGLGTGILGLVAFGLGLSGSANPMTMKVILGALFYVGLATALIRGFHYIHIVDWQTLPAKIEFPPSFVLPIFFLGVYGAYNALLALTPPISYDSLVYHLALPDLYLRHGKVFATPYEVYSGIPQGIEMLSMWLLPWDATGCLPQLLNGSLALLCAGGIVVLGRRLGSVAAGIWGAAIFYTNPMVLLMTANTRVELGASFYVLLCLLALVLHTQIGGVASLVLVGIFAGLALGAKYQLVVLMPAVAAVLWRTKGFRAGLRSFKIAAGAAVVVFLPWIVKNAVFYRNPIYPFFDAFFSPQSVVIPGALAADARARDLLQTFGSLEGFKNFSLHFWSYASLKTNDLENLMSIVYLMILPACFLTRPRKPATGLFLFAAAMWLPMNAVASMARFSIPALVPLSLGAAFVLVSLTENIWSAAQPLIGLGFLACGFFAFTVGTADRWSSLESPKSAADYLASEQPSYPSPPFAAYQWANRNLPARAKVLLIGEQRAFYLRRDWLAASVFARNPLVDFIKSASSSEDLYRKLRAEQITTLFINKGEFLRVEQGLDLTAEQWALFDQFWHDHLQLVFPDYPREPERIFDFAFLQLVDVPVSKIAQEIPDFLRKIPKN